MTKTLLNEAETLLLGRSLGKVLPPSAVILLDGELGTGKTTLVRGIALGLAIPSNVRVKSPSYQMLNRYEGGRLILNHVDAYFLEQPEELQEWGLLDALSDGEVLVAEWGAKLRDELPVDLLEISLSHLRSGGRTVEWRYHCAPNAELAVRIGTVL